MNFVIYFLLTCVLSIWQRFFFYKDVGACFGNCFLVSHGSLMSCNIISKCGKDSLMFQNPFLVRIPYSFQLHKEPNKSEHSTTTQKHPNLAGSRGKISEVKKVRKGDENCVEKPKQQPNFYAREDKVISVFLTYKQMILLVCKDINSSAF